MFILHLTFQLDEFDSQAAHSAVVNFFRRHFALLLAAEPGLLRSILSEKAVSNDLGCMVPRPMALLERREVRDSHFHYMYRLTPKAVNWITNTKKDLLDVRGILDETEKAIRRQAIGYQVRMGGITPEMYAQLPLAELSEMAKSAASKPGEKKFPKPLKAAPQPPEGGDSVSPLLRLYATARLAKELNDQETGQASPYASQLAGLERSVNELRRVREARLDEETKDQNAVPPAKQLQSPPGQVTLSEREAKDIVAGMHELRNELSRERQHSSELESLLRAKVQEEQGNKLAPDSAERLEEARQPGEEKGAAQPPKFNLWTEAGWGIIGLPEFKELVRHGAARGVREGQKWWLAKQEQTNKVWRTLVHEVVEPRSRISIKDLASGAEVPIDQLNLLLAEIADKLDLLIEEDSDGPHIRHRDYEYRGMPESDGPSKPGTED